MSMDKRTRQLLVICGIAAAWRGDNSQAESIRLALPELVSDMVIRDQCQTIFSVLLDNRRLTKPDYSPCEELFEALAAAPPKKTAPFNKMSV
jgi:hypothetical protein